jgi:hypothetical protein
MRTWTRTIHPVTSEVASEVGQGRLGGTVEYRWALGSCSLGCGVWGLDTVQSA